MRDFMTVQEAAIRWGVTERQVQMLCKNEKIEGVSRIGRNWIIPIDTEKPKDGRIKSGRYCNIDRER